MEMSQTCIQSGIAMLKSCLHSDRATLWAMPTSHRSVLSDRRVRMTCNTNTSLRDNFVPNAQRTQPFLLTPGSPPCAAATVSPAAFEDYKEGEEE